MPSGNYSLRGQRALHRYPRWSKDRSRRGHLKSRAFLRSGEFDTYEARFRVAIDQAVVCYTCGSLWVCGVFKIDEHRGHNYGFCEKPDTKDWRFIYGSAA